MKVYQRLAHAFKGEGVTATFGMVVAGHVLNKLAAPAVHPTAALLS